MQMQIVARLRDILILIVVETITRMVSGHKPPGHPPPPDKASWTKPSCAKNPPDNPLPQTNIPYELSEKSHAHFLRKFPYLFKRSLHGFASLHP